MTQKHHHPQIKKKLKTVQSPGMAIVFWDFCRVLLVDFPPPGSTVNAAAYKETLKRLKEAIWKKRPGLLTTGILFLHNNCAQTGIFGSKIIDLSREKRVCGCRNVKGNSSSSVVKLQVGTNAQ